MSDSAEQQRSVLQRIAHQAMQDAGLLPDFSPQELSEVDKMQPPPIRNDQTYRDLRSLLWASIDNDDSLDLDQLTVAQPLSAGQVKILVAIADVDALVKEGSATNDHAQHNTTSVYTPATIFAMLPEKLSTDLTCLKAGADRPSIVIDMTLAADGSVQGSSIYRAYVHNHAKLAYDSVAAWLDGSAAAPDPINAVNGLADNLRLQDQAAQKMKNLRHMHGALSLETNESHAVFDGDQISALHVDSKNRAKELIEDFMIAANGVTARFLAAKQFPSIRRVVRTPERWDKIVQVASAHGFKLPDAPDAKALEDFLTKQRAADALHFPDLSLTIIKLIGSGEYVAEPPGGTAPGHFGLAVSDYTHSTAPNRRYPDLITQRLLKAAIAGGSVPYSDADLGTLAQHCTQEEDEAKKVERRVEKSAAALFIESKVGQQFDALVTGASEKGTWVRLFDPMIEGKLVQGFQGIDVGDRIRVQLISVDVEKGFIDFRKVGPQQATNAQYRPA